MKKIHVRRSLYICSGILRRALPTRGLRINEETARIPMRTPISTSLDPDCER
jgi:hypothetical protein